MATVVGAGAFPACFGATTPRGDVATGATTESNGAVGGGACESDEELEGADDEVDDGEVPPSFCASGFGAAGWGGLGKVTGAGTGGKDELDSSFGGAGGGGFGGFKL